MHTSRKQKSDYGNDIPEAIFAGIQLAYHLSINRLHLAKFACEFGELSMSKLENDQYRDAVVGRDQGMNQLLDLLKRFERLDTESWIDCYRYFMVSGILIQAATLLDTFLTNTTTFLIALHPESIGSSTINVKQLIESPSKYAALNEAIRAKVRTISFKSYADRIDELSKNYGLEFDISDSDIAALERASELRNRIVHNQSPLVISISETGKIQSRNDDYPKVDLRTAYKQLEEAWEIFTTVQNRVSAAIIKKIFKKPIPTYLDKNNAPLRLPRRQRWEKIWLIPVVCSLCQMHRSVRFKSVAYQLCTTDWQHSKYGGSYGNHPNPR